MEAGGRLREGQEGRARKDKAGVKEGEGLDGVAGAVRQGWNRWTEGQEEGERGNREAEERECQPCLSCLPSLTPAVVMVLLRQVPVRRSSPPLPWPRQSRCTRTPAGSCTLHEDHLDPPPP